MTTTGVRFLAVLLALLGVVGFALFTTDGPSVSADPVQAGITITAPDPLLVPEGGSATFTVALDSAITGNSLVLVGFYRSDEAVTVSYVLGFDAEDWDEPQSVTVSAAQDDDGADLPFTL